MQHAGQDERTRNQVKLFCMVLANLLLVAPDLLKRLGCLLFCCLKVIPLVGECSETSQCTPPIERVFRGFGELLPIGLSRSLQLPLQRVDFAQYGNSSARSIGIP